MAAVAEHTQDASRRDVARFISEHERCDSDFQIRRFSESGRGGLSVVCNGCGERAGYELGEPGQLRPVSGGAEPPPSGRRVGREELERWLPAPAALPWWVPNAYIVAVICVGLGMIAFGVFRDRQGEHLFGGERSGSESAEQEPADPQPAEPAPPATAQTGAGAAGGGEQKDSGDRAEGPEAELDRVTVLNRFQIGVPSGWTGGMSGGAVVFRPAGDEVEVRVFLESGDQPTRRLSREARQFLAGEHPGAKITDTERLRVGGDRAMRVGVRYPGGEEWATVLSESGYSYLILSRADGRAPGPLKRQAEAALASFHVL